MVNLISSRKLVLLIVSICFLVINVQAEVPRPRGVPLTKAPLYSPTKDFTCFDGTITIPFAYVNDDYCDCFDGSDEPGTSACLNGVFHCTNAGHRPLNIPSSRVNDGICDCCDGTDEYSVPNFCQNTCDYLGREARAEAQRQAELHKQGSQLRLELIEKGNKKRSEMADQLAQLEKDKEEAEKIQSEKEEIKNQLEEKENEALKVYREAEERERQKKEEEVKQKTAQEALEHFTRFDSNNDGILTVDEIKVVNVFDKNKDGQVDEEEAQYFFGEQESVDKDTFLTNTWSLLKPLLMMEQGMFKPAEDTEESEPEQTDDDVESVMDNEDLGTDDENLELDDQQEPEEPESSKGYDEETQKLVDEATEARNQHSAAERTVREIESSIRNIKENLDKDYGLQQEFATLDGTCLDYEDKEYVYTLCLFQKVVQKSKNGGSEIGLGNWGEWVGEEPNKYSVMKYLNGIACWNGPSRTTTVNVQCGLENKILSVTEPFRCEYQMEIVTPSACDETKLQQHSTHDEL